MSARLIKGGAAVCQPPAFARGAMVAAEAAQTGNVLDFIPRSAELGSPVVAAPPLVPTAADPNAELSAARAEAERIVAEAQARASECERQARERGLAEARARADEELARAVEPLRQQLAQTIEELTSLRGLVVARAERDMVKLALEIAKRVVHREVVVDGEVALTLARVALARIHSRAQVRLHLAPEDLTYVAARLESLGEGCSVELVEDRAVGRGGCLVETEMGDIDARIERQFAEVERSLLSL